MDTDDDVNAHSLTLVVLDDHLQSARPAGMFLENGQQQTTSKNPHARTFSVILSVAMSSASPLASKSLSLLSPSLENREL